MADNLARPLSGKRALVLGIANDQSIAYGCARAFRRQGAEPAITHLNERRPVRRAPGPGAGGVDLPAPGRPAGGPVRSPATGRRRGMPRPGWQVGPGTAFPQAWRFGTDP